MEWSMKKRLRGDNTARGTKNAEEGSIRMKIWSYLAMTFLCCSVTIGVAAGAFAREPLPTAIFPFGLINTSPEAARPDEATRLKALDHALRDALVRSDCCAPIEPVPVTTQTAETGTPSCDGCDVDLAKKVGARISVTGWVQKVSELILNINLVARDVQTGKTISVGSVDIRGNTDESWSRGLSYLLRNRLHPSDWLKAPS